MPSNLHIQMAQYNNTIDQGHACVHLVPNAITDILMTIIFLFYNWRRPCRPSITRPMLWGWQHGIVVIVSELIECRENAKQNSAQTSQYDSLASTGLMGLSSKATRPPIESE